METNRLLKILLENGAIKQSQIDDEFLAERLADDEERRIAGIAHIAKLELIEMNRTKEREEEIIEEIRKLVDIYPKAEKILRDKRIFNLLWFGAGVWCFNGFYHTIFSGVVVLVLTSYFFAILFLLIAEQLKPRRSDVELAKESIRYAPHM